MAVQPSIPGEVRCMRCGQFFMSPDRLRVRRCKDCKRHEDGHEPRRVFVDEVTGRVRRGKYP